MPDELTVFNPAHDTMVTIRLSETSRRADAHLLAALLLGTEEERARSREDFERNARENERLQNRKPRVSMVMFKPHDDELEFYRDWMRHREWMSCNPVYRLMVRKVELVMWPERAR